MILTKGIYLQKLKSIYKCLCLNIPFIILVFTAEVSLIKLKELNNMKTSVIICLALVSLFATVQSIPLDLPFEDAEFLGEETGYLVDLEQGT